MTVVDAAIRGRRNRAKGNLCEYNVAKWLRLYFPDACRAVRNTVPDPGDVAATHPGLFWSVKDCQVERISVWMGELDAKRRDATGMLVVRRRGKSSPGEWWCWLRLGTLLELSGANGYEIGLDVDAPLRMELRDVMPLLVVANLAPGKGVGEW